SEKVPTLRFGKKGIGEMLPAVAVRPQDMECFATRRRVDDARRQVRGLVEAEPLERHVDHPRWTLPTDSRIPDHLQIAESSVQLPGLPLPIPALGRTKSKFAGDIGFETDIDLAGFDLLQI